MNWKPITEKPEGFERKVLLWVNTSRAFTYRPNIGPEIGWWRHGPSLFSYDDIEDASCVATHWAEISAPDGAQS